MKSDRWQQVDELFEAALERDSAERSTYLDQACGSDANLRREVEKMLAFDEQAADFIEKDVFNLAAGLMTGQTDLSGRPTLDKKIASKSRAATTGDSIDGSRFVSGDLLSDRYRIFGLLGRGGMGEVYRADDLKLKQPVALKFLPKSLSAKGAALARFYKEVSVARQISHRHVCRVYDVGEYEGEHFISMEFVRGEELSSLLKRIGRLPPDKAVEIARQLCAGLAAVHERKVLHRDLKPANIMIDEHGDVRITDFGIAAIAEEVDRRDAMSGTPAYMSPEQLEGGELTVKSDIYSLGVVLYELFTGKRVFEAASLPELIQLRKSHPTPTNPSSLVSDLDPLVERLIFRCLEQDPDKRPPSALQVAAALPGGDPLAAALAAGETPSPEMVAAAPKEGGLRPAVATALLASLILMIGIACFFSGKITLYQQVPLSKSPEVLRDRAIEIVKRLGYVTPPADSAYGMGVDEGYLTYIEETDNSPSRWQRLSTGQPAAIYFWYRQSPRPFEVSNAGTVAENSPPRDMAGMTTMTLDTLGRLRSFYAVPPQTGPASSETGSPNWSILLGESGLDPAKLQSVPSIRTPPHESTVRAAWEGSYPDQPALKIRVEAALYDGKPVYFEIIDSWDRPPEPRTSLGSIEGRTIIILLLTVFITVLLGGAFLAWRNLRLGRGDRKGAFRLAAFVFVAFFLLWLFTGHHVPTEKEALSFLWSLQRALFWGGFFWVVYIAFEPFVRRRWAARIISWNRVLAGGFRDPLVGRDILIGSLFGVGSLFCTLYLADLIPRWFGRPPRTPWFDFPATQLLGLESFAGAFIGQIYGTLVFSFVLLFLFFLLYFVLRRELLAIIATWAILVVIGSLVQGTLAGIPFAGAAAFLLVWVLFRYGLLALIAAQFFNHFLVFFPITSEFTAWYATDFVLALIIAMSLVLWGFYTSLAGQPLFRPAFPDD